LQKQSCTKSPCGGWGVVKAWLLAKQRWAGKAAEAEGLRTAVGTSPGGIKREKLLPVDLLLVGKG